MHPFSWLSTRTLANWQCRQQYGTIWNNMERTTFQKCVQKWNTKELCTGTAWREHREGWTMKPLLHSTPQFASCWALCIAGTGGAATGLSFSLGRVGAATTCCQDSREGWKSISSTPILGIAVGPNKTLSCGSWSWPTTCKYVQVYTPGKLSKEKCRIHVDPYSSRPHWAWLRLETFPHFSTLAPQSELG